MVSCCSLMSYREEACNLKQVFVSRWYSVRCGFINLKLSFFSTINVLLLNYLSITLDICITKIHVACSVKYEIEGSILGAFK
jgi:hypothetical protein